MKWQELFYKHHLSTPFDGFKDIENYKDKEISASSPEEKNRILSDCEQLIQKYTFFDPAIEKNFKDLKNELLHLKTNADEGMRTDVQTIAVTLEEKHQEVINITAKLKNIAHKTSIALVFEPKNVKIIPIKFGPVNTFGTNLFLNNQLTRQGLLMGKRTTGLNGELIFSASLDDILKAIKKLAFKTVTVVVNTDNLVNPPQTPQETKDPEKKLTVTTRSRR